MQEYLRALKYIKENGKKSSNRTGIDTYRVFGTQHFYDLSLGFPATTTKTLAWKVLVAELIWFLRGATNVFELSEIAYNDPDIPNIWTANYENQARALGYDEGYLGPIYGSQWRDFNAEGIDQIFNLIKDIKNNPESRRLIVTAWNPARISEMALPPCHCFTQFNVSEGKLDCLMYQRSADMFLGVPFNIASYSLLTHIIAAITDLEVGTFVHTIGDAHIYENHMEQVDLQLTREPYPLPKLKINVDLKALYTMYGPSMFNMLQVSDFVLEDYQHHPAIKAVMAV